MLYGVQDTECLLQRFSEPILQFIGEAPGIPALPLPPPGELTLVDSFNPFAILVGFGVAVETLSIGVLLVMAVVAMLRPRRCAIII